MIFLLSGVLGKKKYKMQGAKVKKGLTKRTKSFVRKENYNSGN
jgi:hypothetical protein